MRNPLDFRTPADPEWGESGYKDIIRDTVTFRESLPLPLVTYPGVYGTWIAFQEGPATQPLLCECQRSAVSKALRFKCDVRWQEPNFVEAVLPKAVWTVNQLRGASPDEVVDLPLFRPGICHLCCRRVPPVRWSNLGTHSAFLQHFGWYWHYALLARGVNPTGSFLLPLEQLDSGVAKLVDLPAPEKALKHFRQLCEKHRFRLFLEDVRDRPPTGLWSSSPGYLEAWTLGQKLNAQRRRIESHVEAELREVLGFPRRGRTGFAEALLLWIVRGLFPAQVVKDHARPPELQGLELDLYLPALRLGIEYQGHQHYYALDHLGGEKGLRNVRRRDKTKAQRCKYAGIDLVEVTIADRLSEGFVRDRILNQCPRLRDHMPAVSAV